MITAYNRCKVVGRIYTSSMLMFQKVAARLYIRSAFGFRIYGYAKGRVYASPPSGKAYVSAFQVSRVFHI